MEVWALVTGRRPTSAPWPAGPTTRRWSTGFLVLTTHRHQCGAKEADTPRTEKLMVTGRSRPEPVTTVTDHALALREYATGPHRLDIHTAM